MVNVVVCCCSWQCFGGAFQVRNLLCGAAKQGLMRAVMKLRRQSLNKREGVFAVKSLNDIERRGDVAQILAQASTRSEVKGA